MASDYDNQLIESVTVRRQRLLSALLYGENPNDRRWMDSLRLFILSVAAAAVIASICVGYSFVSNLLTDNRATQEQQTRQQGDSSPLPAAAAPDARSSKPRFGTGA